MKTLASAPRGPRAGGPSGYFWRLLAVWLLAAAPVWALNPERRADSYSIQGWFTEDGLPSNKIRAIIHARDGYLWLATAQGLARFDGSSFTVFTGATNPELRGGGFFAALEALDGTLWFGGDNGLFRWRNGRFDHFTTADGLANNYVRTLGLTRDGRIAVGTRTGYSFMRDGRLTTPGGVWKQVTGVARSYLEQANGAILLGTDDGLWRITGDKIETLSGPDRMPGGGFTGLLESPDGSLWIGNSLGVHQLRPDGTRTDYGTAQGMTTPRVAALRFDHDGNLWIAAYGSLYRLAGGRIELAKYGDNLSSTTIQQMQEDREGGLWLASATGLFRLKDNISSSIGAKEGLGQTAVYSLLAARDGGWWIGLWGGGVYRYEGGRATRLAVPATLGLDQILSFAEETDGTIWIGANTGLYRNAHGVVTNLYQSDKAAAWQKQLAGNPTGVLPGIAHSRVNALAPDGAGGMWVATDGALYHGVEGAFRAYTTADGLPGNIFKSVVRVRNGDIWVTMPPFGVACWHGDKWTVYPCGKAISEVYPRAVYEDAAGSIWVTTEGGGLNRFKDGRWRNFTVRDGLADDFIAGIVEDGLGNFWVACPRGIMRIPAREFDEIDQGRRTRVEPRIFTRHDGLPEGESNQQGAPNAVRAADGRLLFATDRGVAVIDPAHLKVNALKPPVYVERVVVNGADADLGHPIVVSPGNNDLAIHYTAISLLAPEKVQFKIRLDPLDSDWTDAGSRRDVRYAKLPPGQYSFRVMGSNNDGVWNEQEVAVSFTVRRYFYQTDWFIGILLGCVLATGFVLYQLRSQRARRQMAILAGLVDERTRELQAAKEAAEAAASSKNEVIGALKKAQDETARQQARFNFIFESLPVGIAWMVGGQIGTRIVNPAHAEISGVPLNRCQDIALYRLATHPEDRAMQDKLHGQLAAGEIDHYAVEKRYMHPDGSVRWVELIVRFFRNAGNGETQEISTLVDITGRKQSEARLREATGRLAALWEKAPLSIMLFEPNDPQVPVKIVDCNPVASEIHGYTKEELVGQCVDLIEFAPWTENSQNWLAQLRKHHRLTGEGRHKRKDGTVFDIEYFTSLIVVDGHEYVIGMDHVVTERKKIEGHLAYERNLLRALLDNSLDQIYFKDTQSRFLRTSRAQARSFGLAYAEDIIGKTDFDFFADVHARPAFDDEQQIVRTGQPMIDKIERETWKDGREETWVLTSKMPLRNEAGEIIGTFGISKDITAIKRAEQKLEQMQGQLRDASRQAGMAEVATGVLHNVGNVLNSVNVSATLVSDQVRRSKSVNLTKVCELMDQHAADLGAFFTTDPKGKMLPAYLQTLAENLAGEQTAMITELENLRKNIEHIKEIVAMQQTYAKTSGAVETISVPDLMEDAIRINSGSLARHDVDLVREYLARPVLTLDKHKVIQILINLVRNAKYACDETGRTDKRIIARLSADEQRVRIAIIDNGVGIPPENLTRIFGHGFTTRKHGHGFGLHSGALAAKELGGALIVQSEGLGHGATFILELPLKPVSTPALAVAGAVA